MLSKLKNPAAQGVPQGNPASGTAQIFITAGETIWGLLLVLGGTSFTKAMITALRVYVVTAGTQRMTFELSGSQLQAINAHNGGQADAARLKVPFTDAMMKRLEDEYESGYGLGNLGPKDGLLVEVDISGANAPTLESYRYVGNGAALDDSIMAMRKSTLVMPSADTYEFPLGAGEGEAWVAVDQLFLFGSNISLVQVWEDGVLRYEDVPAGMVFDQLEAGKVPQSPYSSQLCIDFAMLGSRVESLRPRNVGRLTLKITGNGNVTMVRKGLYDVSKGGAN